MSKRQSQLLPDAYSRCRSARGIKTLGAYPALSWTRRTLCGKMSSLFLICVSFYIFCAYVTLVASKPDSRSGRQRPTTSDGFALPESAHSWAMYTPYYPLDDYVPPPQHCEIVQVNILQRHGARYPTKSASKAVKKALKKLQGAKKFTDPQMYFLHNFTYSLGKDDLVPFGAAESYDAGEQAFWRYADLMSEDKLPFVRASSKQRVVDSATNWTAGFAAASHQQYAPVVSVILSESVGQRHPGRRELPERRVSGRTGRGVAGGVRAEHHRGAQRVRTGGGPGRRRHGEPDEPVPVRDDGQDGTERVLRAVRAAGGVRWVRVRGRWRWRWSGVLRGRGMVTF
ncbi:hypothetical protein AcV7_002773 [Taiwanofungus camphoratus]|nr:hypothetical protein AcV7_002773 [Antrodia cinnamomea]